MIFNLICLSIHQHIYGWLLFILVHMLVFGVVHGPQYLVVKYSKELWCTFTNCQRGISEHQHLKGNLNMEPQQKTLWLPPLKVRKKSFVKSFIPFNLADWHFCQSSAVPWFSQTFDPSTLRMCQEIAVIYLTQLEWSSLWKILRNEVSTLPLSSQNNNIIP